MVSTFWIAWSPLILCYGISVVSIDSKAVKVEDLLVAGGAQKDVYMTDRVTHVIADEEGDEVTEARELFELPVVKVKPPCLHLVELNCNT